jgi:hypothetical protein
MPMTLKTHCFTSLSVCTILIAIFYFRKDDIKASDTHAYEQGINITAKDDTVRKVITAMLAMQRRAWEQGVAAQAMLELRE